MSATWLQPDMLFLKAKEAIKGRRVHYVASLVMLPVSRYTPPAFRKHMDRLIFDMSPTFRILRVVTLDDMVTIHNAFPDRRFKL